MNKKKRCTNCKQEKEIEKDFGFRTVGLNKKIEQPQCSLCRNARYPAQWDAAATHEQINALYRRCYPGDNAPRRSFKFMADKLERLFPNRQFIKAVQDASL